MTSTTFRVVVRRQTAAGGEYLWHDGLQIDIHWDVPPEQRPEPVSLVVIKNFALDARTGIYSSRLLLYRYPEGEERLGYADVE
jgi:hypothetical protein